MNRRGFIQVAGLGAGTVLLGSQLQACDSGEAKVIGWEVPQSGDIRLRLLAHAMLAPNPHNTQAWRVLLINDKDLLLYVDPDRLLPETDPYYRQIHIGQGTFLELLRIAASHFGLAADIDYFPEGEYDNQTLADKPVAKVSLREGGGKEDPLFQQIFKRHSNKRAYDNKPLSAKTVAAITKAMRGSHSELQFYPAQQHRPTIQKTLVEAMAIESTNKNRDLETIAMFRFNDDEINQYRDGFGLAQSGVTGVKRFIAESLFLSRERAKKTPTQFGQQAIDSVKTVANSTQSFAWLSTSTNTRLDQVKTGHDYCRLNLITTQLGLAQHPMSQVLQEYDDMLPLQQQFKSDLDVPESDTVQMFCRLGRAPRCAHSPRRDLTSILV